MRGLAFVLTLLVSVSIFRVCLVKEPITIQGALEYVSTSIPFDLELTQERLIKLNNKRAEVQQLIDAGISKIATDFKNFVSRGRNIVEKIFFALGFIVTDFIPSIFSLILSLFLYIGRIVDYMSLGVTFLGDLILTFSDYFTYIYGIFA